MLKENIISEIRKSKKLKANLQMVLDKSAPTIQRYLDDNDIMLTTQAALTAISETLGIPADELIETEKVNN